MMRIDAIRCRFTLDLAHTPTTTPILQFSDCDTGFQKGHSPRKSPTNATSTSPRTAPEVAYPQPYNFVTLHCDPASDPEETNHAICAEKIIGFCDVFHNFCEFFCTRSLS